MSDAGLLDAVGEAVRSMPRGHIESLATAIAPLPRFEAAAYGRVATALANSAFRSNAQKLLRAWAETPAASGASMALALRASSTARADALAEETVEVVWTGPTSHEIPIRRTREVLVELIGSATGHLTIVSFAAYRVEEVSDALRSATGRRVRVRLVLETAEDSQGRLTRDAAAAFQALKGLAVFYIWPTAKRMEHGPAGALHAKAAIADTHAAFITSANLTGNAMSANMELGLLVRGGPVPGRLASHFDALIADGTLVEVTR